jgi:hypothetical protein
VVERAGSVVVVKIGAEVDCVITGSSVVLSPRRVVAIVDCSEVSVAVSFRSGSFPKNREHDTIEDAKKVKSIIAEITFFNYFSPNIMFFVRAKIRRTYSPLFFISERWFIS